MPKKKVAEKIKSGSQNPIDENYTCVYFKHKVTVTGDDPAVYLPYPKKYSLKSEKYEDLKQYTTLVEEKESENCGC